MRRLMVVAFALVSVLLIHARSQGLDLDRLEEKVNQHLQTKMPGWKHERGEPMKGSENVLIEYWSSGNRKVKIALIPMKSAEEAREKMKEFPRSTREAEELSGFGDQAYSWGYGGSNVFFRRGRFAVFVSTYAEVDSDPDARNLNQAERGEREKSEMTRLSREFAKHMVSAIDLP